MSSRRLLGAHLPASFPERRETVAAQCLGCQTQFAVDVRLRLPTTCPDYGADVLARADIEGPVNADLVDRNWADILRVAATMASGTMRPSQILRKLAAYPRQNELAAAQGRALQECGPAARRC